MISSLLLSLALSTSHAHAQDQQSTAMTSQQTATLLLQQQERLAAAEARAKRAEKALAQAKAEPAQQTVVVERVEPAPAPVADPRIAALEAELAQANADYAALAAALSNPVVNVTVQPAPVTILPKPTRLIGYVGGGLIFAGPVPDVSGPVAGRAVAGVRPSMKIPGAPNLQVAFTAEGSYESLGLGGRLSPELLISGNSGEWGIGGGITYACNAWQGNGCLANYYGGMVRGTWTPKSVVGPMAFVNAEFGGLTVTGVETASAFRVVGGVTLRFGTANPNSVTVE